MATALATSTPAAAQTSFDRQTIRLVIASTTGGTLDMLGRQFAPFIAKHVPGSPTVIVENRPGAVGVVAANYVYNVAKPDGLTIGFLLAMVTQGLMAGEGVRYEPAKFQWLGAVSQTQVLLARKDLGLTSPSDLVKPAKPLVLAASGAGSTVDAANRLFLEMIGARYQYVTGYPGQAETALALARGEASLANTGHTFYLSRRESIRKEGVYDAFLQRGELGPDGNFRRNRQLAELPTMVEVIGDLNAPALRSADFATYRSIVGALALQFSFVLPPATSPGIVDALRKAVSAGLEDPEARKSVQAILKAVYEFVDGPASQRIVEQLRGEFSGDARIAQRLKEILAGK